MKNALITGAGSGLGQALAKSLVNEGYHVCLTGRTEDKLKKVQAEVGGETSVHILDVRDKSQVTDTFKEFTDKFGDIDLLINNAGMGVFDLTENLDGSAVDTMIDTNLKGTIFCTQEVIPAMKKNNKGQIVQVVSTAGVDAKVNETVYCASKFGVKGYTDSLRLEVEDTDIRVNAFYMGGMNTNFWDGILDESTTKNLMDPVDIADIIMNNIGNYSRTNIADVIIRNA